MRSVRKKQKNFYKFLKGLVIFSVIFIFVYIGAEPYVKAYSANLAVGVNYACDILVLANLVVIFLYYSKYGKVESFLKDIENELEDAGYYISSREKENINDRCDTICKDLENNGYKISKNFDVKDFSFNVRALKGKNYFYIIKIENLDKNDVLAYLDEMIYDLTSNCFKHKGNGVLCLITDNAQEDAVEISKMITPLGRKGQLKIALAIDETDTGNVYFQGNEETKNKTLIANFVMNCDMPIKDNYIHKEKMPFQLELEKKAEKFTLKDFNNGNFYLH